MSATVVVHPAFQWRMDLYELCLLVGCYGYTLTNRRGQSGRSWLALPAQRIRHEV